MRLTALVLLALLGISAGQNVHSEAKRAKARDISADSTCKAISDNITTASAVYYPSIFYCSVVLSGDLCSSLVVSYKPTTLCERNFPLG